MDRKSTIHKYIKAALLRLRIEKIVYTMQSGIFFAVVSAVLVFVLSRLFVIPYYERIAMTIAVLIMAGTVFYTVYNRVRKNEATRQLDQYIPHNLLLTAVSIEDSESLLASSIIEEANLKVSKAYEGFKRREKNFLNLKMLLGCIASSAFLILLITFPSEAQIEAEAIEQEKVIVDEIKKEVEKLIVKEKIPENKTALKDLLVDLKDAETSEEALKELVKKQKELRLQELRLTEKKKLAAESTNPADGLSDAEEQELTALKELATNLAKSVGKSNTALSKIGKGMALPALAEIADSSAGKGEGKSEGQGKAEGQGEGEGQGKSEGQGKAEGQGEGQGKGQGQGEGQGAGQGSGIGKGSGGRDLLSIPSERIGTAATPDIDGGNLNEGESVEEREAFGPTERGTVRPYNEVIGNYKKSYLESTGKMNLSPDLQRVLSDYFSSIE